MYIIVGVIVYNVERLQTNDAMNQNKLKAFM